MSLADVNRAMTRGAGGRRVTLPAHLVQLAANVGVARNVHALTRGRSHRYGATDAVGWAAHLDGAIGELAAAEHLGLTWSAFAVDATPEADLVGGRWPVQVRATPYATGQLLLHRPDPPDHVYVLARVLGLTVELAGWVWGAHAKRDEWWGTLPGRSDRPCFIVPADALRSVDDLVEQMSGAA